MLRKGLGIYTRYFAIWVVVFGLAAYWRPGPFIALKGGMVWFFAFTMFAIGAVLEVKDFKRIISRPVIVLIGCCSQYTFMPLGAFVVGRLLGLPGEAAAGLILTGSAPGAMASNVMSYIAGADAAYSVSLTTVSTLLCPILTPALTFALAGARLEVGFVDMVMDLVYMVVLPLGAGFVLRYYLRGWVKRIEGVFAAISVTFIIFICSLVVALNRDYLPAATGAIFGGVVLLNAYGMAAGYGVGRVFRMEAARRRTLSIEIGMQNAGLGTVLALRHLGERAAIPAALFVFWCIITASVMSALWQRRGSAGDVQGVPPVSSSL